MGRGFPSVPLPIAAGVALGLLSWSAISVHQQNGQEEEVASQKKTKGRTVITITAILDSVDMERG